MLPAPIPYNDTARVRALTDTGLMSSQREIDFDRVTRTVADFFEVPIALVSLVSDDRQCFKSRVGLAETETARDISFCGHAILQNDVFVVPDAQSDTRFADNPLVVADPYVRFYAGTPLYSTNGYCIGTLCIIDHEPKEFSQENTQRLRDFGRWLQLVLEKRFLSEPQIQLLSELGYERRSEMLLPTIDVWNRKGFNQLLSRQMQKSIRDRAPIAVALINVDHGPGVDAARDSMANDARLANVVSILKESTRTYDVLAQLDVRKFAVIMPGAKRPDVRSLGEKLRDALDCNGGICAGPRMKANVGVAWFGLDTLPLDQEEIMETAEYALDRAKMDVDNRVFVTEGNDAYFIVD